MFEKYKTEKFCEGMWGIRKRFLLFFYKTLTYTKVVFYNRLETPLESDVWCSSNNTKKRICSASSTERLTFSTVADAAAELDKLNTGSGEIRRMLYQKGKLIFTGRHS